MILATYLKNNVFATERSAFLSKHFLKSVRIRSFSSPYFSAFGLNTQRYSVSLCFQFECGKIQTRKSPNTGTFQEVKNREIDSNLLNYTASDLTHTLLFGKTSFDTSTNKRVVYAQQLILFYLRKGSKNYFLKIYISPCIIIIHPKYF